ncbi:hypothetical protein AB0P36_35090 [Streptomyces flavidovirens]|uniref:hypothetical protein n=1 Tax=Streptomyces flavidovirens TaxID=67298 RepID=UPI00342E25C5
MKTDLALARQEITALREERDKLKDAVRRQLGQQLDQVGTGELVARIDELSRQNAELTAERDELTRGKAEWEEKLADAQGEHQPGCPRSRMSPVIGRSRFPPPRGNALTEHLVTIL